MLKFTFLTRKQRILLIGLTLLIILSILYAALHDNIHSVIPGQVYRSAQLTPAGISRLAHLKGIRTIVNLRGPNFDQPWYKKEIRTARTLKLNHYDIALKSTRPPSKQQLQRLSAILQHAPKPILVHCESGVDRSGLASAMALVLLKNATDEQAAKQFSWHYLVTSKNSVGKLVFAQYHSWLKKNQLPASRLTFEKWINNA